MRTHSLILGVLPHILNPFTMRAQLETTQEGFRLLTLNASNAWDQLWTPIRPTLNIAPPTKRLCPYRHGQRAFLLVDSPEDNSRSKSYVHDGCVAFITATRTI
mmetsp:Transcript_14186/g.39271  ORF Transcript_14186/g.39271 Transcript_14186/m.39271 type:complete len:103 (+) Transcript_14186:56-364(+)